MNTPMFIQSGIKVRFIGKLPTILICTIFMLIGLWGTSLQAADGGSWTDTGSMSIARGGFTATLLPNGRVLVAGGETGVSRTATASAEIYNPNTGEWTATASMHQARSWPVATLLPNGKVLVAGGTSGDSFTTATAEIYDPITATWTLTGEMKTPRRQHIVTTMNIGPLAGQVLVAGGYTPLCGNGDITGCSELYNPGTGKWAAVGNMTFPSVYHGDKALQLTNGKVLVVGGIKLSIGYQPVNDATIFNPVTQKWTATASKKTDAQGSGVLLSDGKVLVAGGRDSNYQPVSSAELFDPKTGAWTPTASMSTVRASPTITRLPNGNVLVAGGNAGGWDQWDNLSSAEIYDPHRGNWTTSASMSKVRDFHIATLLQNGKVLVVGGYDNNGNVLSSAELYTPAVIPVPAQLLSLGDINKDNNPEIAVITYNPTLKKSTATVKNAQTGALVKRIPFDGQFVPNKANVLPDLNGNGAAEIAVLGIRSSDQAVQVEVRDSLSGVKLSAMLFDPAFKPLDLGVVRDINGKGTAGLAVLQQNATQLRVQLKNALTGAQIRNISFNANYKGIDLLVISDLNANQSREIAVLADNKTTSAADIVEIHDSKTGALIRTISYGSGQELKQLINLPDLNNNGGAELAVLRANTARVSLKDALSGLPVNMLDYALSQSFKLASVADSNSQIHLAMLGVRASDGQPRAEVHDALSDTLINKVIYDNYGTTVGFISIPDINGNGVAELVRLREQPGPQKLFAEVRDGRTGALLQGMYF